MFYFIPAWYTDHFMFEEKTWFRSSETMYDETISQLHLFAKAKEPCTILSLAYQPQLRSFLQREGLTSIPVINIFDDLQSISSTEIGLFSYRDLHWDDDLTWLSTPFVMCALKQGEMYAQVYFNQEGRLLSVTFYHHQKPVKELFFDDRGFLSSIREKQMQTFYNESGTSVFTYHRDDGHVTSSHLPKTYYDSLEELIIEALKKRIASLQADDPLVIAAHLLHKNLFAQLRKPFIIALFEKRYPLDNEETKAFAPASFVLSDHAYKANQLRQNPALTYTPVYHLTPYDTRFTPGISQRMKTLKIYYPMQTMEDFTGLEEILDYLVNHPLCELHLGLANSNQDFKAPVKEALKPLCAAKGLPLEKESVDEITEVSKPRIFIHQMMTHSDLMQVLHETRLIVDLRHHPDIISQIAAISVGIPTIVRHPTEYIYHMRNGLILDQGYTLTQALDYYLTSLKHWNVSLVYCFELISHHDRDRIIASWKEILSSEGDRDE